MTYVLVFIRDEIEENNESFANCYLNELIQEIDKKIQEFSNDYNYFTIRVKLENASMDFKVSFSYFIICISVL